MAPATRQKRGLKATVTYEGGRTQGYAYDADARNTGIRDRMAGSDIQRFTYTFDASGNRIGTVDLNGSVTTYTLDALNRLTEDLTVGTDAHTFTYTYDSRGNLLTSSETGAVVAHAYDAASRLLTSTAGVVVTTFTYDVNGNMVQANAGGVVTANTNDRENRLTATSTGANVGAFQFGADFHRKKEGSTELFYLDDLIIGEGQGGALRKLYLQLGGQLVGEVVDITPEQSEPYSYLVDILGTVTAMLDPDDDLQFVRRMTPYGRRLSGAALRTGEPNWVGAHGYRYSNHPFAQMYVWHRVYALETSQWTTRDLLWPEERAYGYVNGNVVSRFDVSGLREDCRTRTGFYSSIASNAPYDRASHCFAFVSGLICDFVKSPVSALCSLLPAPIRPICSFAVRKCQGWADCMNSCIFDCFRPSRKGCGPSAKSCWDRARSNLHCQIVAGFFDPVEWNPCYGHLGPTEFTMERCCQSRTFCEQEQFTHCLSSDRCGSGEFRFGGKGFTCMAIMQSVSSLAGFGFRFQGSEWQRQQDAFKNCCTSTSAVRLHVGYR